MNNAERQALFGKRHREDKKKNKKPQHRYKRTNQLELSKIPGMNPCVAIGKQFVIESTNPKKR